MLDRRFLVTGAMGCLGAWTVKRLLEAGAAVNVTGTTVVLETARRCRGQIQGLVYASSGGVFGPKEANPSRPLTDDTPLNPPTL